MRGRESLEKAISKEARSRRQRCVTSVNSYQCTWKLLTRG